MASKAVADAILARLAAAWRHTPIVTANAGGGVPRLDTPFLSLAFPIGTEQQITIGAPGSNLFREEGAFRLVLSVPAGHGLSPFDQWMDELRALFRGQLFAGVTTWAAPPPVIDERPDAGAYVELSLAVPYRFDLLG